MESKLDINSIINPRKNTDPKENIKDPRTPDKVLFGLIFVNFFHLKVFPNMYPPRSELIVKMITQINKTKDDAVSFLKYKIESKASTSIPSKKIMDIFLLNDENNSKLPKTKTTYKKDTM